MISVDGVPRFGGFESRAKVLRHLEVFPMIKARRRYSRTEPCLGKARISGDSIDYLKELLQRINDLHNELESTPTGSQLQSSSSFHSLTLMPSTLSYCVKEELFPGSLPSPENQLAKAYGLR